MRHICCGIMSYLRAESLPNIDFSKDAYLCCSRDVLDSEMKWLQKERVDSKHHQAELLTQEQEEQLWKKGVLGQHTGRSLVDTMLFMCGTYIAL